MNALRVPIHRIAIGVLIGAGLVATLAGCPLPPGGPVPSTPYDQGFDDGFLRDDWYWTGFFDSFDSLDFETVYYQGSDIPFLDDNSYDAGYYDGIWYAYNDGYFTDYRYAFIIGFSEGYDAAFFPGYLNFLANDVHVENLNGGWGDGWNDGFSEGRIFGAADYEDGRVFDWLDAFLDYESGTDLYFAEIDLGTGIFGPVFLYEYGVDPFDLAKSAPIRPERKAAHRTIRQEPGAKGIDAPLYRPLIDDAKSELNVIANNPDRSTRTLRFTNSWLDRINIYLSGANSIVGKSGEEAPRGRSVAH